jgi:hypothetical protein
MPLATKFRDPIRSLVDSLNRTGEVGVCLRLNFRTPSENMGVPLLPSLMRRSISQMSTPLQDRGPAGLLTYHYGLLKREEVI